MHPVKWSVPVLLVCAILVPAAGIRAAEEVALGDIVPEYMGSDLETAIIPTPKHTALRDRAVRLEGPVVCVAPDLLVKAAAALRESGLVQERSRLRQSDLGRPADSRKAWREFEDRWKSVQERHTAPGWPSPLGVADELMELFPELEFRTGLPAEAGRPVLLFAVDGVNSEVLEKAGDATPALPGVADPTAAAERYVLAVTHDGAPLMVSHGATPWGALWGIQTLRQMVFDTGDQRYVRLGTVRDYPTLIFRGGKRAKDWWVRYKGNGRFERWPYEFPMRKIPRSHSHYVSARPVHVDRHKNALRGAVAESATHFLLDFNDGRFWTPENADDTPAEKREPFPGDPARTVKHLLNELRKERTALQSEIRIGYMPVAYAINRGATTEGAKLRAVDALQDVDFVMMNGLEVFCGHFPAKGAEVYREALGTDAKLMMYDCQGCRRPLRTPDYRDPDVYTQLLGVSAQVSSPIFFIGLADFTWSPETYDPERALKLALRELSGRDPETYRRLHAFVTYYIANSYTPRFLERPAMLAQFKKHTDNMVERLEAVAPLLDQSHMARLTELDLAGPVDARIAHGDMIEQHGFKNYAVRRAEHITVDGKLDEPDWRAAPTMTSFFPPDFKDLSREPLPEGGRSVTARALYDDNRLYVGYDVSGATEDTLAYLKDVLHTGGDAPDGKIAPAFEMFIKTDLAHDLRWQLMHLVPGVAKSHVLHYFDPESPLAGNTWQHTAEVTGAVTGENSYTVEVAIDYWEEITPPKKGDVWGVQLQLNRVLGGRSTPYWLYQWSYAWENEGLWSWEYPYGRWRFE